MILRIFLSLLISLPTITYAHSGRTNSEGCHAGKKPYHCHGGPKMVASPSGRRVKDKNCSDFRSWREAQTFFENAGLNDPHELDTHNDGVACESLR